MPNAADQSFDWAAKDAINMARVEAGSVAKVKSFLGTLESDLIKILAENKDIAPGKKAKLETILKASSDAIGSTYSKVASEHAADLKGVAKAQSKGAAKMINAGVGVDVMGAVLTESQLAAVASDTAVFGHPSAAWWAAQKDDLRFKYAAQIRQGYALGEDVDALARRIRGTKANGYTDGIMQVSRREAEALVRTSIQTISNEARLKSFEALKDTIKGIQWVATLDTRTTPTCRALDGKVWTYPDLKPVKHNKAFPGPIAHWNCRSTQIPVLYSWEELSGKKIKALDDETFESKVAAKLKAKGMAPEQIAKAKSKARASMDGQVAADHDTGAWLKGKSSAEIRGMLGPGRAKLFESGKLTISDLTDQNNRPLTVAQLEAAIDAGSIPVETEGADFAPFDPKLAKAPSQKAAKAIQDAAAAKIQSVTADPTGQKLLAQSLAKVQADEPSLSPAETLAKAEEMAATKQAAATKSATLSKAKKKLLAGDEPTPAQKAAIADLTPEEKAAFDESVADAKAVKQKAEVDAKKAALKAKIDAALAKDPTVNPYKGDLFAEAWELATIDEQSGLDVESYAIAQTAKANATAQLAKWNADPIKQKAVSDALAKGVPVDDPVAVMQAADEALGMIVATEATGNQLAAAKKAMKSLTGMDGPTAQSLNHWLTKEGKDPAEFLAEFQAVTKEKAEQAAKSSVLSKAKKKLVAGEPPTPGQKATIDSLTPEEKAAFDESVADAKAKIEATKQVAQLQSKVDDVPDPAKMKIIRTLPGSTRPVLMEDANGKKWVVKSPDAGGGGKPHLQNEAAADALYRLIGADVPRSQYMEIDGRPYKVAEFLDGAKTLGEWERTATPAQREEMHRRISENFVADALMGNWDVMGQANDNLMVTADGRPVRIDNGGALDFRAMGAKKTAAQWNATVSELKTLRDPSTAAGQTAKVFAGLTEADINRQIVALVGRRDELVAEVRRLKGDDVADVFRGRLDYLENQLPADARRSGVDQQARRQDAFAAIPTDVAQRIENARANGFALPVGTTHVEDMQALSWKERDANGNIVSVTQLKVTDEGSRAIMDAIGGELKKAAPASAAPIAPSGPPTAGPVPDDFKPKWEAMAKTLNTHAADGQFNAGTVANFNSELQVAKSKLAAMQADASPKSALQKAQMEQLTHYVALGDQLAAIHGEYAKATAAGQKGTTPVPWVTPSAKVIEDFVDDPAIAKAKAATAAAEKKAREEAAQLAALQPKPTFTVTHATRFDAPVNSIQNGRLTNSGAAQGYGVEQGVYRLQFSDGTEVTFVPRSGRLGVDGRKQGLALEGLVRVRIPADADHQAVMKTLDTLESIGVNTPAASDDYREMVWLAKTVHVKNDTDKPGWRKIQSMDDGPQKVAAARQWIESEYRTELPKRGQQGYTADGVPNSFGDGFRHVYRADLTREQAEVEMAGYALQHEFYGSTVEDALDGMLNSGGEATATTGRLRKGVPISGVGWSADSDINSGGADFFFTRIRKKEHVSNGAIAFKVGNIARADAVTYTSDLYGQTGNRTYRRTDPSDFRQIAAVRSSDETIFKNGLFLLDEIDFIKSKNPTQRKRILAVFKKHGVETFPDGRNVKDVVQ